MQIAVANHPTKITAVKVAIMLFSLLLCCQAAAMDNEGVDTGLSLGVLKSITYHGIEDLPGQVMLTNGDWKGNPEVPRAAIEKTVNLVDDFVARGDLDGDDQEEAAVLLSYWPGGTGVFVNLAVVDHQQGKAQNVATVSLGDRVQVRDVWIENREVIVDMIAAGPEDTACCPSQKVRKTWTLAAGKLHDVAGAPPLVRVSAKDIGDQEWTLISWAEQQPVAAGTKITLTYQDGKFAGSSGCNRYFVEVKDGERGEAITVSAQIGATRMACEEPVMAEEQRFLGLLAKVNRFWFRPGRLALDYTLDDGRLGVLLFQRQSH